MGRVGGRGELGLGRGVGRVGVEGGVGGRPERHMIS